MARPRFERLLAKSQVLQLVSARKHTWTTVEDLTRAIQDVSPSTVRRAAQEMVKTGQLLVKHLKGHRGRPALAYIVLQGDSTHEK